MSVEEFAAKYKPIPVPEGLDGANLWMEDINDKVVDYSFETYGETVEYVCLIANSKPRNVFTIIDDGVSQDLVEGYHYVNRMGYVITEVPLEEGLFINVNLWCEEDFK